MGTPIYVEESEAASLEEAKLQAELYQIDTVDQDPHECCCKDCNCNDEIPE